jgi:hypothetical protein
MTIGDHAPNKSHRLQCWEARDSYFECLDKHGLWFNGVPPKSYHETLALDPSSLPLPLKENQALFICQLASDFFEKQCLPSWVFFYIFLYIGPTFFSIETKRHSIKSIKRKIK